MACSNEIRMYNLIAKKIQKLKKKPSPINDERIRIFRSIQEPYKKEWYGYVRKCKMKRRELNGNNKR